MKMFCVIVLFRCFVLCVSHANLRDNPVLKCGVEASSSLIHHNPWLVYLQYYRRDHLADIRCAGTLIDSRHIVTAAHCVKKIKYQRFKDIKAACDVRVTQSKSTKHVLAARLGEYDVSSDLDCLQGICSETVDIEISDVFIHPGYDSHRHDIAVLRLAKEAPYTDFIRPVCLPTGAVRQDVTFYAAGWGVKPSTYLYSNLKKIIPLPYCPTSQCQKAYSNLNLTDDIICAGGEEGIDTCKGDSGGPLMWIKERTELWGVTSSGNVICGTKGAPAIYTSVPEHLDWIKTVIEDL